MKIINSGSISIKKKDKQKYVLFIISIYTYINGLLLVHICGTIPSARLYLDDMLCVNLT